MAGEAGLECQLTDFAFGAVEQGVGDVDGAADAADDELLRSEDAPDQRLETLGERVLDIWEACGDFFQVSGSDLAITERLSAIEESASIRLKNIEDELRKAERAAEAVRVLTERSSIGTYAAAFTADADRQTKGAPGDG